LDDIDRRNRLRELIEADHAHFDGSGGHRVNDLVLGIELAAIEDLECQGAVRALLDEFLELCEIDPEMVRERELKRYAKLGLAKRSLAPKRHSDKDQQNTHTKQSSLLQVDVL
jgi:hypothetical protein